MPSPLQRVFSSLSTSLSIFGTTVLLFLLLNLILGVFFKFKGTQGEAPIQEALLIEQKYPDLHDKMKKLGVADPQMLLREMYSKGFVYEPFTGFREHPHSGKWVNIDPAGFRQNGSALPWPPRKDKPTVFFFGGSTTFGYGVMDAQTLPAFFSQSRSQAQVYNFGRANYYSTQERILFEQLLMKGHVPQIAVFVDGLNDFQHFDSEIYQEDLLAAFWERRLEPICKPYVDTWVANIPVVRLLASLKKRLRPEPTATFVPETDVAHNPEQIQKVISRYLWNKKAIEAVAKAHGIKTLFVWQPVPRYAYNLEYHQFKHLGFGKHSLSGFGYPEMRKLYDQKILGSNFLWLADSAKTWTEPVYIDQVHYSAPFNKLLAGRILDAIR